MARRLEEGEPTEVELHAAAERAEERWRDRVAARGSSLSLDGGSCVAQANPTDVDQILDNLLENAVTYAPGAIELHTGIADGRAFLAVRDHGAGIAPGERSKVTERFYRGSTAPPAVRAWAWRSRATWPSDGAARSRCRTPRAAARVSRCGSARRGVGVGGP